MSIQNERELFRAMMVEKYHVPDDDECFDEDSEMNDNFSFWEESRAPLLSRIAELEEQLKVEQDEHALTIGERDEAIANMLGTEEVRQEEIALAQSRIDALSKDAEWQPIETAPKTGRTILIGYFNKLGNWRTMRGEWFSREYIDEYFEDPDMVEPGWYEVPVEADEPPNCWPTNPTHWMPLPKPPVINAAMEVSS